MTVRLNLESLFLFLPLLHFISSPCFLFNFFTNFLQFSSSTSINLLRPLLDAQSFRLLVAELLIIWGLYLNGSHWVQQLSCQVLCLRLQQPLESDHLSSPLHLFALLASNPFRLYKRLEGISTLPTWCESSNEQKARLDWIWIFSFNDLSDEQ